ncbi:SURF1 family protein [Luteimonas sp. e5]
MKRSTAWLGWGVALLLVGVFCLLGSWQLRRMQQKQAMLDEVATVIAERRPQPLASAADIARATRYDWVAGQGRFLPGPAWLLDNQQLDGHPGVRVYRLFQAEAATPPMLVELGWLPLPPARELPVLPPPPDAPLQVRGLLLPPPSPGLLADAPLPGEGDVRLVIALEPARMADSLGLPGIAPRVLRLDPALPLGHARDLDVMPNTLLPRQHLGYAVQWFALACAVLVLALVLSFRHRRRR